jgi:hypothetical protein
MNHHICGGVNDRDIIQIFYANKGVLFVWRENDGPTARTNFDSANFPQGFEVQY